MKYCFKIATAFAGLWLFNCQQAKCQAPTFDKLVDFLPPAPNAASIVKYGNATLNKNTGTPNISIPLYTLKGIKLSTTVSIGYSSNGIKVDEIASRVGMGWTINAGGVITRTVRGVPDETNTRHYPYATIGGNWATFNYMNRIANSYDTHGYNGGFDSEPDLFSFSFDGYSGSFVLDGSNYVLLNKSGLKLQVDFSYSATWNFKITTPEGISYVFGGATATEKTKRLQSCGKTYDAYLASSWYLKEIQHPNGEKITFNYTAQTYQYDNGVSQTMYSPITNGAAAGCNCSPIIPYICTNSTSTMGVLLSSIVSPGRGAINFQYTSRPDCDDKLISGISLTDPVNIIGSFNLGYTTVTASNSYTNEYYLHQDKTPYLISLTENSSDNVQTKTHYFSYIDPESRPYRLSFSQDHWGYFNGKVNTSFTPNLGTTFYSTIFPLATGNREPDFLYAQKGLLKKIVYPTGGTTAIFYEPNVYDIGYDPYATAHTLSCDVTGSGMWVQESRTKTFHNDLAQDMQIQIQCRDNSGTGSFDIVHNKGTFEIKNVATGQIVYTDNFSPGYNINITASLPGGSADYQLTLTANGTVVTTAATLHFKPTSITPISTIRQAGGARVQKIVTTNAGDAPMVKRYFYGTLDNLNASSLNGVAQPRYLGEMLKGQPCTGLPGDYACNYQTLNSSSLLSLGHYNNALISYNSVVESIGENFEGGGTESKFFTGSDALGQVVWNRDIINSPFSNFSSYYNAKPYTETLVKKNSNGGFIPVKKTEYVYNNDPAGDNTIDGYSVVQRIGNINSTSFDTLCDPNVNPNVFWSCAEQMTSQLDRFNMVKYSIFSNWVYPKTVIQTSYDENGANPQVTTTNTFYENILHFQPTKTEETNSKGQLLRTTNRYPHDFAATGDYGAMISNNIIAPVINSKSEIVNSPAPNTPLAEQQVNYANTGNNNFGIVSIQKSAKGNTLETEGTIDQYDDNGNILQFTSKTGIVTAIVWGYNSLYPVAQVVGSTYANVVAQLTGGSVTALQTMDGTTLLTELNRIRTNIPAARVTSYTYKHLAGVQSITDANNKTNSYTYDAFSRLMLVKDQDGNIVKKNAYIYTTPDANAGITIYYNQVNTQSIQCATCLSGFTGTLVSYTVPYGKYYSLISQADADAQASNDLLLNGQEYANKNGTCSNTITCTAPGYKFVSCGCELGIRTCESSTLNGNGTYTNVLHLTWSDGSVSPSFTETAPACTGIDKKHIGCNCETGTKVCENVTNNGGGSYTLSYHYHFSDNTNSTTVTETITCSGPGQKIIGCTCETGIKIYTSSTFNPKGSGSCPGQWTCYFYYRWSDNSTQTGSECSSTDCGPYY